MTTTLTLIPASDKQIKFLSDLLAARETTPDELEMWTAALESGYFDKKGASSLIDELLKRPKVAKPKSGMQALLASVPKSKYAVPVAELEFTDADDKFTGDLVFIELKEYMQTLYMRQLHGAPGAFNRSKLSSKSVKAIIEIVAKDAYKYAKIFGEHYTCCGSCGAELTDPKSRELMLGPECRKKFGW